MEWDKDTKKKLQEVANTIRHLTMDAVEKAGSGHPGLPMGNAELGAYLYGLFLNYHPQNPNWVGRDRFILSAGHGSLLLYTCLHFSGFPLSIEDIKNFRQLGSKTPSHPDVTITEGIEATTGVDGQGIGYGVGQALALKLMQSVDRGPLSELLNAKVIVLAGDGCLMEGISHEACSLAGHWKLDNLILLYDSNKTCLDGFVDETFSENTRLRFESYGWDIEEINGHDFEDIHRVFSKVRQKQKKPLLIISHTIIGKGSPTHQGSYSAHGKPFGKEEILLARKALGLPDIDFYVCPDVYEYFQHKIAGNIGNYKKWEEVFSSWKRQNIAAADRFECMLQKKIDSSFFQKVESLSISSLPLATRKASQEVLNFLAGELPFLYGGSADLASSDCTFLKDYENMEAPLFEGRNIKYGVREFAMGAIACGLSLTKAFIPFIGTFLAFTDYMRSAIRMSALMRLQVIYQLTHDSLWIGQDGPTHQPIEHIASLRAIPNLLVIRPADSHEIKSAWIAALKHPGPSCLILSRQAINNTEGTTVGYEKGLGRGGYIIYPEKSPHLDFVLLATGSEVALALEVAKEMEKRQKHCRVVSMPCLELFDKQSKEYRAFVLGNGHGIKVSIEAGSQQGWHKYVGEGGICISIEAFGASGSKASLAEKFGFTPTLIIEKLLSHEPCYSL